MPWGPSMPSHRNRANQWINREYPQIPDVLHAENQDTGHDNVRSRKTDQLGWVERFTEGRKTKMTDGDRDHLQETDTHLSITSKAKAIKTEKDDKTQHIFAVAAAI